MKTFQELGLSKELLAAVDALGYQEPMAVQEQVIPFILNETTDLVALAQTGTGKTAAFGLPILQQIEASEAKTQVLILSPTRELCLQISNDLEGYAKELKSVRIVALYGGESIVNQFKRLDDTPQVIVATPGRLIDLINRGKVQLNSVRFLVLDEADEMLNMGFLEDLEIILKSVPNTRRTLLFSATMPLSIAAIAKNYMTNAQEIAIGTRNAGAENVEHIFYLVQASQRYLALKRVVDINPDIYGIVFCRTRQETKDVADKLMRDGYNADALHGDLSQAQREAVMNKFRIRNLQLLVATDVAARGLDVSDLTHVINYNIPTDVEIYTHRSGRTGRANKTGVSVALVTQKEKPRIREIEKSIGKSFTQQNVPNGIEVCRKQLFSFIDKMENVQVSNDQIEAFIPQIISKLEYLDKEEIIVRFVSLEFNRILDYYKNAEDLNVIDTLKSSRKERKNDSNKGDNYSKTGKKVRFKINIGTKHNASPRSILSLINDITNDNSIHIGAIDISNKFSFFEVYADQAQQLANAFKNSAYDGLFLSEVSPRSDERKGDTNYKRKDYGNKRSGFSHGKRNERDYHSGNRSRKRNKE